MLEGWIRRQLTLNVCVWRFRAGSSNNLKTISIVYSSYQLAMSNGKYLDTVFLLVVVRRELKKLVQW